MAARATRDASGCSDEDVDNLQAEQQVSRLHAELAELRGAGDTEALLRAKDERIAQLEAAAMQTAQNVAAQLAAKERQIRELQAQLGARPTDEQLQAEKDKRETAEKLATQAAAQLQARGALLVQQRDALQRMKHEMLASRHALASFFSACPPMSGEKTESG